MQSMLTIYLSQSLQFTNHAHVTRDQKNKLTLNRKNKIIFSNNRVTPTWNFLANNCFAIDLKQSFKNKLHSLDFTRFLCGYLLCLRCVY